MIPESWRACSVVLFHAIFPVSNTQTSYIEARPKFEITTEEKDELEKGIVNEKLMDFMNDVAINGLKELGFTNTSGIRREDITFSKTVAGAEVLTDLQNKNLLYEGQFLLWVLHLE